jgi:hypothetical protein
VTQQDLDRVQNITLQFLQDYLTEVFALSIEFDFTEIQGNLVTANTSLDPPSLDFTALAVFATSSLPTTTDLDLLVQTAFSGPEVNNLITALQQEIGNPFSATTSVQYSVTAP